MTVSILELLEFLCNVIIINNHTENLQIQEIVAYRNISDILKVNRYVDSILSKLKENSVHRVIIRMYITLISEMRFIKVDSKNRYVNRIRI